MAKRKPLEVEEVSEPQAETEASAGLTFEIGLVLATTVALVIGLVLGWMELQKFAEM
jgi:hypothetical protein